MLGPTITNSKQRGWIGKILAVSLLPLATGHLASCKKTFATVRVDRTAPLMFHLTKSLMHNHHQKLLLNTIPKQRVYKIWQAHSIEVPGKCNSKPAFRQSPNSVFRFRPVLNELFFEWLKKKTAEVCLFLMPFFGGEGFRYFSKNAVADPNVGQEPFFGSCQQKTRLKRTQNWVQVFPGDRNDGWFGLVV